MILGIDAGNDGTKICGPLGVQRYSSSIGEYNPLNMREQFDSDDLVFEYNGRIGLAGTLAQFESDWGYAVKGDSKSHEDAILRTLLAIIRYSDHDEHSIVVGQPIATYTDEEKQRIKRRLTGRHEIVVNGRRRVVRINRVEVAPEGAAAAMSDPKPGLVRIIDIGSGTVNCATLHDMKRINLESFTISKGMETVKSNDPEQMARGIANLTLGKWRKDDYVRLVGGGIHAAGIAKDEVHRLQTSPANQSKSNGFFQICGRIDTFLRGI